MADPMSSADTAVNSGVSLDPAEPSSQATMVDEGYQTSHVGKDPIPRSSGKHTTN